MKNSLIHIYHVSRRVAGLVMEDKRESSVGGDHESGETTDIIINEVDGLPNLHPNYRQLELELEAERDRGDTNARTIDELIRDEDLPTSVIVTNVDPRVFKDPQITVIAIRGLGKLPQRTITSILSFAERNRNSVQTVR